MHSTSQSGIYPELLLAAVLLATQADKFMALLGQQLLQLWGKWQVPAENELFWDQSQSQQNWGYSLMAEWRYSTLPTPKFRGPKSAFSIPACLTQVVLAFTCCSIFSVPKGMTSLLAHITLPNGPCLPTMPFHLVFLKHRYNSIPCSEIVSGYFILIKQSPNSISQYS